MTNLLSGRIALVTGASRGIGAATALALARAGAHVIAMARTVGGLEELDDAIKQAGGSATLVPLDVKDHAGIGRLAQAVRERYGRLDILIGNAGVLGVPSPLSHVEEKVWDETIAVNLTANWHIIRAFDSLLRASDAGRAVFITSGTVPLALAYWGPYVASKAAIEALGRVYANETATTAVRVNLFNPGPTRTRLRASAMPGEDPMTLPPPEEVAELIVPLCLPSFRESGKLYDFPKRALLAFLPPA